MSVYKNLGLLISLLLLTIVTVGCEEEYEIPAAEVPRSDYPTVILSTPEGMGIDRSLLEHCQISIIDAAGAECLTGEVGIKGRGNSSWVKKKKPYTLIFGKDTQVLDFPSCQSWVILGNYFDCSLMRNDIAFFMGRELSRMDYTPRCAFADFMLNGYYQGIYLLGENPIIAPGRILDGKDGVLLEINGKARYHEITFQTTRLHHPISIHHPEVKEGDGEYLWIKEWVQHAEDALFADNFTDPEHGYRRYLDMDSFVDWYIINEIAKNNDAIFFTSCFMYMEKGGKLKMGPLWDFDNAFGDYYFKDNTTEPDDPENFFIRQAEWYARLFEDPVFVNRVKIRFGDYYAHRQAIYDHIEDNYRLLVGKVALDNRLWGRLCDKSSSEEKVRSVYREHLDWLKDWIERRMQWLKTHLDAL